MLVHSHEKMDLVPPEAMIARDRVGADLLVGVTNVWVAVRVIDRRRQVEPFHSSSPSPSSPSSPASGGTASTPLALGSELPSCRARPRRPPRRPRRRRGG